MRLAESLGRRCRRPARIDIGELGDGQRVEQLNVAQAATPAFEIRLGAVGDLTAALPPRPGVLDEFVEARADSGAPLPSRPTYQKRGEIGIARDVPRLQHGQPSGDVLTGDLQRLGHRAHTVIDANVGVPQGIPQQLGDLADHIDGHVVVQQRQVEVGVRHQFATAQTARGHDGEAAGGRDADLGCLCGEPEFVQIEQGIPQCGRIQLPGTACQQLFAGGGKVGSRTGRTRRRSFPSRGPGGGISSLLFHFVSSPGPYQLTLTVQRPGDDLLFRHAAQRASVPRSPVRTRTTVSTGLTHTLPSPIFPVRAA